MALEDLAVLMELAVGLEKHITYHLRDSGGQDESLVPPHYDIHAVASVSHGGQDESLVPPCTRRSVCLFSRWSNEKGSPTPHRKADKPFVRVHGGGEHSTTHRVNHLYIHRPAHFEQLVSTLFFFLDTRHQEEVTKRRRIRVAEHSSRATPARTSLVRSPHTRHARPHGFQR